MQFKGSLKWHHVTITAYGWWLPGDPRGFRTKKHREHVEGDYKSPPKEDYRPRLEQSWELLKHRPVVISRRDRPVVTATLLRALDFLKLDAACIATAGSHCHLLCKLPTGNPKSVVGVLKREVTLQFRDRYELPFWAGRCHHVWADRRDHWTNVMQYVVRHERRGGALWLWDGPQSADEHANAREIRERRIRERVVEHGEDWYKADRVRPTKKPRV